MAATAKKNGKPTPKKKSVYAIRAWLEKQDDYTLHRPVRKRFARIPYSVTNVMNVWECDLLDVQAYAKYNENYKYILSVKYVFSKFLHMIPIKTKSAHSVVSTFRTIFDESKYLKNRRRPIWVRTDKGKVFLSKHFQDMLRDEVRGIQFQVCSNPDLKCALHDTRENL